jgi:hypothetical protein
MNLCPPGDTLVERRKNPEATSYLARHHHHPTQKIMVGSASKAAPPASMLIVRQLVDVGSVACRTYIFPRDNEAVTFPNIPSTA